MAIFFIGGSPCSGKSTMAQEISEKYGFLYFKVDENLSRYIGMGAKEGKACCLKIGKMTPEEIWMREPEEQCEEELQIYEEIFPYVMADLNALGNSHEIITEGAAFLPVLAKKMKIPFDRYFSITPTKAFQVIHYSKREWVPYVLEGCSDQRKAFENWMERDALFATAVQQQCRELGFASFINDGSRTKEEMLKQVTDHFGLK